MVNEGAALLDRHVTSVTPNRFSSDVYTFPGSQKMAETSSGYAITTDKIESNLNSRGCSLGAFWAQWRG
jgi:hypothetical protein